MRARRRFGVAVLGLAAMALLLGGARDARAALITFSGASSNGENPIPSSYQPLLFGYPARGATAADGGPLGVTITWNNVWTSNHAVQPAVTDHTGDTPGVVLFDQGNTSVSLTFSKPVTIPSFYFANYFNGTNIPIEFQGFTNPTDTTPVIDIALTYSQPTGYNWIEETGFGNTPVEKIVITGELYKQIDDMTVDLVVPEPSSLALLSLGGLALAGWRRWKKRVTA